MTQKFTLIVIGLRLISAKPVAFKPESKEVAKHYVYVPAADASHKGFYISSIEITNKQYRDFLADLDASGETEKLKRALVDTLHWKGFLGSNSEPYVRYYFQHKAYDDYPAGRPHQK
jgi:formylglycine-generating enzyme required for sulfatase activity